MYWLDEGLSLPLESWSAIQYFHFSVLKLLANWLSLIWTKISFSHFYDVLFTSGNTDLPSQWDVFLTFAKSKIVAWISNILVSSFIRPPCWKTFPIKEVGTRIELSWHERLYSLFRVLKLFPWSDVKIIALSSNNYKLLITSIMLP